MSEDYFRILGLQWEASDEEIKRAFKKHAKTWHPDKNTSTKAKEKFQELSWAFEVLTDPVRRHKWEHEYIRRHGARPKKVTGFEVALRPDDTVACAGEDPDEFFSWKTWAKNEDFDKEEEEESAFSSGFPSVSRRKSSGTHFSYSQPEINDTLSGAAFSGVSSRNKSDAKLFNSDLLSGGSSSISNHTKSSGPKLSNSDLLSGGSSSRSSHTKSSVPKLSNAETKTSDSFSAGLPRASSCTQSSDLHSELSSTSSADFLKANSCTKSSSGLFGLKFSKTSFAGSSIDSSHTKSSSAQSKHSESKPGKVSSQHSSEDTQKWSNVVENICSQAKLCSSDGSQTYRLELKAKSGSLSHTKSSGLNASHTDLKYSGAFGQTSTRRAQEIPCSKYMCTGGDDEDSELIHPQKKSSRTSIDLSDLESGEYC
jgi:curved DNA-binding protein CbpA